MIERIEKDVDHVRSLGRVVDYHTGVGELRVWEGKSKVRFSCMRWSGLGKMEQEERSGEMHVCMKWVGTAGVVTMNVCVCVCVDRSILTWSGRSD